MKTSFFDLYKVGIGPSSSHTMGPMRAARGFATALASTAKLDRTARVRADLYGSLALTGIGHGTDRAVLLGLSGEAAASIDPESIEPKLQAIRLNGELMLMGSHRVPFREADDLLFHRGQMFPPGATTQHPNGVRFTAFDAQAVTLLEETYFSIGGGFVVPDGESPDAPFATNPVAIPFPFASAAEMLSMAEDNGLAIWELMLANESALRPEQDVRDGVQRIWQVMEKCIDRGMVAEGILPGGLNVRRRAARLAQRLREKSAEGKGSGDPLAPLDWVTVYAMAVNEENAAGGRVVTAPTNGAAGVVPAVARYYRDFITGADDAGLLRYFLTSAAIGVLYKENASISGAEVGCQGEVGVACSMAAGGLAAALDGSNAQVEHAAEMNETEGHKISLDQIIKTMYLTGLDMQSRYKETSLAGLALNVIEC